MGLRSIDNIGFEDGKGPAAMAGDEFELGFGEGGSEVGPVYPTNFPAGLKLWYVEPLMLNDSEKVFGTEMDGMGWDQWSGIDRRR